MATKNFAPTMTFTESEKRLPKRESLGTTRTGMLLTANKGYGNIPINIKTESQLADVFGYPTEKNYKMWFDAAGYLKYANELYVVRPINTAWASGGIGVAHTTYNGSPGTVSTETQANLYNPDIAEYTIENTDTNETIKIEFYPKSVSSDDDIAVAICSRQSDFTSPVFDEDATIIHSTYVAPNTGTVTTINGTATLSGSKYYTTINSVSTEVYHGFTLIVLDETYKLYKFNAILSNYTGSHTGSGNASTLTDSTKSWTTNEWAGHVILNLTDGSRATISSNTANTITATLSGGTDNDWDVSDEYRILPVFEISSPLEAVTSSSILFVEESVTASYKKKFGTLALSGSGERTFTAFDPQPLTYTTVKNVTTNFVSYVVPNYLGSSLYGSDKKPATYQQLLKPEPDWLKWECGVIVFKKDSQGYWQLAETFIGSWDETAKTTSGQSKYIKNVINKNSNYLYCLAHPVADADATTDYEFSTKNYKLIDCVLKTQESDDFSDYSAFASADLETAAEIFGANGLMQPELLIAFDNNRTAGYLDTMPLIANETGFSVAIVSLYNNESDVGKDEEDLNTAVIDALGNQRDDTSVGALTEFNTYTMAFGQMKYFYDKYNDKYRWVPISGDMAGLLTRNDLLYGVQSALAGINRGTYNNFSKLFTKGTYNQDELSKNGINQIIFDYDTQSYMLFDFLTNTQLDLITKEANIRRMVIYIKQFLKRTLKGNFFEYNNESTRSTTLYKISIMFEQLKKAGGLFDYLLICDETNNTAEKINANEFVLDVRLQPNRIIKYIYVNISNYDMGLDIRET